MNTPNGLFTARQQICQQIRQYRVLSFPTKAQEKAEYVYVTIFFLETCDVYELVDRVRVLLQNLSVA